MFMRVTKSTAPVAPEMGAALRMVRVNALANYTLREYNYC
jgi:hypothetical protein